MSEGNKWDVLVVILTYGVKLLIPLPPEQLVKMREFMAEVLLEKHCKGKVSIVHIHNEPWNEPDLACFHSSDLIGFYVAKYTGPDPASRIAGILEKEVGHGEEWKNKGDDK